MQIKKLPVSERPYEKLELYGSDNLSNAELLAIIIKTGTKEKTSIELAQEILSIRNSNVANNNMRFLQDLSIQELMKINGIGKVKSIQIKAVCELAKRMAKPLNINKIQINSAKDVIELVMDELKVERREKIKELILDSKNKLIKIIDISFGGTNSAQLTIEQALSEPLKISANSIILVHNHPSGNPKPSEQDIITTKKLYLAARFMGIQLLDHIIIGDDKYESVLAPIRDNLEKQAKEINT